MSRIDFRMWGILAIIASIASMSHAQTTEPAIQLGWSHPATSRTPIQNREFHGPFGHEDLTVTADGLGKHDFIEISFDLFIMSSWDGSLPPLPDGTLEPVGPDYFRLGIQGGPTLMYHTFSNIALKDPPGFSAAHPMSKAQSYPSQIPGTRLPPWTGASEFNTLGYAYTDARVAQVPFVPMDATYRIHFVVPHSDFKAVLEFNGLHLQDPFDENWGIANLSVRSLTAAQVKKPAEDSIGVAFRSCLGANPNEYVEAFQTLINGMDATADWINKNVKPAPVDKNVPALIAKLQAGAATDVAAARMDLVRIGPMVEPYLRDARIASESRVRSEIDTVLETIGVLPITKDEEKQAILAARVLEIIGTPRALAVRNNLVPAELPPSVHELHIPGAPGPQAGNRAGY